MFLSDVSQGPVGERLAEALIALTTIREPIRGVVSLAPRAPAPDLRLPAAVEDYPSLITEVCENLFIAPAWNNHPRWTELARSLPDGEATAVYDAAEAVYLWYQALGITRDYVLGDGLFSRTRPTAEQARVLLRLERLTRRAASRGVTTRCPATPPEGRASVVGLDAHL